MAVTLKIQFNGKYLTIPINPEELNLSRSADNDDIEIIGLGKATRKGEPGLYSLTISSFFPKYKSYFGTNVKPKTCVNFINTIWKTENKNNTVAKITSTGLHKNFNFYFVIESFDWIYKAGEEDDIYYELKIKEYKPYGVKTVKTKLVKTATKKKTTKKTSTPRTTSTAVTREVKITTYKVQKGDCLWNIAKAASGSGANWKQLYNLNKKVIGSNPNLIKPGQVLTLPDGWKGSIKVQKLKGTSSKKQQKSTSSTKYGATRYYTLKYNGTDIQQGAVQGPKVSTSTLKTNRTIAPSDVSKLAAKGTITLNTSKNKSGGGKSF